MQKGRLRWFVHTPHFPFSEVRKISIYLPSFVCTTVKESTVNIYISVLVSLACGAVTDDWILDVLHYTKIATFLYQRET